MRTKTYHKGRSSGFAEKRWIENKKKLEWRMEEERMVHLGLLRGQKTKGPARKKMVRENVSAGAYGGAHNRYRPAKSPLAKLEKERDASQGREKKRRQDSPE